MQANSCLSFQINLKFIFSYLPTESARTIRLKLSNSQINSPTKDQLPIIASPDNEDDDDVTTSQQVAMQLLTQYIQIVCINCLQTYLLLF